MEDTLKTVMCLCQQRWTKLEDEMFIITSLMDELEQLESEEKSGTSTSVYMILKKKLDLYNDEQRFLDSILAVIRK